MSFDITPAVPLGRQLIQSYGDGRFIISDQTYDHPVIIFPERTLVWKPGDLAVPTLEAFSAVFDADPRGYSFGRLWPDLPFYTADVPENDQRKGRRSRAHGYRLGLPHL